MLKDIPDIPIEVTKVSQLENDADYQSGAQVTASIEAYHDVTKAEVDHTHEQYLEESDLDGYATEQWVNDQGFLKEHQDISGKADVSYVDAELAKKEDRIGDTHHISAEYIDGLVIPDVPVKSISVNGEAVPADEDKNVDITVPTKTSDIEKDDVYTKEETEEYVRTHGSSMMYITSDDEAAECDLAYNTSVIYRSENLAELTIRLPEDMEIGFTSEVTFWNLHEPTEGRLPEGVKYFQFGRYVSEAKLSVNAKINMVFHYDGIDVCCYVSETQRY